VVTAKARIETHEGRVLVVPVVIPDLNEVREYAAKRHAEGVPWKGELFGWSEEYNPERAEPPLDSRMSFTPAGYARRDQLGGNGLTGVSWRSRRDHGCAAVPESAGLRRLLAAG
jgi:hypothetical protein